MRILIWTMNIIIGISFLTGHLEKNLCQYFVMVFLLFSLTIDRLLKKQKRKNVSEIKKEMDDFIKMIERKNKIKNIINLKRKEKDNGKRK